MDSGSTTRFLIHFISSIHSGSRLEFQNFQKKTNTRRSFMFVFCFPTLDSLEVCTYDGWGPDNLTLRPRWNPFRNGFYLLFPKEGPQGFFVRVDLGSLRLACLLVCLSALALCPIAFLFFFFLLLPACPLTDRRFVFNASIRSPLPIRDSLTSLVSSPRPSMESLRGTAACPTIGRLTKSWGEKSPFRAGVWVFSATVIASNAGDFDIEDRARSTESSVQPCSLARNDSQVLRPIDFSYCLVRR